MRHSPRKVFESLKHHYLSGFNHGALVEIWGLYAAVSIILTLFGSLSLYVILVMKDSNRAFAGEPGAMLELVVLIGFLVPAFLSAILTTWSIVQRLPFLESMFFFSIPIAGFAGWSAGITNSGSLHWSALEQLLSSGLCIAGLLTIHSILAFVFQWRVLWPFHAIAAWLISTASAHYRMSMADQLTAWLLFLAPTRDPNQFGWRNQDDYDYLIKICEIENGGADWRGLIVPVAALLIAVNIRVIYEVPSVIDIGIITPLARYLGVNPLFFMGIYLLLAAALGFTIELILSKPANVLISLAAAQAKHFLIENPHPKEYGNYRAINLPNPGVIDITRVSWRIIDSVSRQDGVHRCLIEKSAG